jgi:hypothetical protein
MATLVCWKKKLETSTNNSKWFVKPKESPLESCSSGLSFYLAGIYRMVKVGSPGSSQARVSIGGWQFGLPRRVTQAQMAGAAIAPANPRLSVPAVFCRIKDTKT